MLKKLRSLKIKRMDMTDRAYLEISLKNLEHNVNLLIKAMPSKCEFMAVVKAEAYGHGLFEIALYLNKLGVKSFAVATIDEGIKLRQHGIVGEILVLGYTEPTRAKELYKYNLIQTLLDYDYSVLLNSQGYKIKTHIKIDTGMHRLGFDKSDCTNVSAVFSMKNLSVIGMYTHLCVADCRDDQSISFTNTQIDDFYGLVKLLEEKGVAIPKLHIQSSYGLLNYPQLNCDYVRVGIALYGGLVSSSNNTKLNLKPVLSLKSKVVLIRNINKGESVSYMRSFIAERDSKIAILPIGYADGYPRNLSDGKCYVLINGEKAYIVGKICMDQMAVDVTDIPGVNVGMDVTLIGEDDNEEITASFLAENSGSIPYEILSRMGQRLNVIYK